MSTTTMEKLTASMCRWPIGDPREDDFAFCGDRRESGQSYCKEHNDKAYRSSPDRARKT